MRILGAVGRRTGTIFLAGLLGGAAACGVKGDPVPPERLIPNPPSKVRAEATPLGVRLLCEPPRRHTDGSPLRDLDVLEFWRSARVTAACPDCPSRRRKIGEVPYVYPEGSEVATGTVEFLDEGVTPGSYVYRVVARTRRGIPGRPSPSVRIYWDIPPRAVAGLRVKTGDRQAELTWEPVTERSDGRPLEEVAYEVFRGQKGGGLGRSPVNASPLREAYFLDTSVRNNLIYVYRVRALVAAGDQWVYGPLSTPVEAMPQDVIPPAPPEGLVAFPGPQGIRLTWRGGEEKDIAGYRVYRATAPDGPWERLNVQPHASVVFEDKRVEPGKWYWYAVTALDDASPPNESRRSRPVKAQVPRR